MKRATDSIFRIACLAAAALGLVLVAALFADALPTNFFTGPTPSAPVFITNATMDSPFEEMHRMGWGAALVVAFAILSLNVAVRVLARERKR